MSIDNIAAGTLAPANTFLEQLRAATSVSHKNLENLPVSASILSPRVTREEYANYLNLMHDAVKSTETYIFPKLSAVVTDIENRRKLAAIEADLNVLGYAKEDFEPIFNHENQSKGFALGIFYVMEGSSLGGRFILKNIEQNLGYNEDDGAAYFAGYGNKTGSHWKDFLHCMTQYEAANNCGDEIIAGANFAFDAIHEHFATATI